MDIRNIPDAPRYLFTADYIFHVHDKSVDAFPKLDFETGWHIQEFYEINIITKGNGYHCIGDQCIGAAKGDVFIIPPNLRHAFVGGKGFDVYHYLISPILFDKYLSKLRLLPGFLTLFEIEPMMRVHGGSFNHLHLDDGKLAEISVTLNDLYRLTSIEWDKSESARLISECQAIIIIAKLCRYYAEMQKFSDISQEDSFFVASLATIHELFNTNLSIEELAATARLSRTAYLNKFKAVTGLSPKQYVLRERIKSAKNLLSTTDKPIATIAEETGFFDTAHFTKCFTAEVGISPSRYRGEVKKDK